MKHSDSVMADRHQWYINMDIYISILDQVLKSGSDEDF